MIRNFLLNQHRIVYFLLKNPTVYFFHGPLFHQEWEKKHLEHIFSGVLEALADSTMELIESRCGGAQWNSKAFFCLSL